MTPIDKIAILLGSIVSAIAIGKAGFAIAQFFAQLAESVKTLTHAVEALAARFDEHADRVTHDLSDVRERVARLEER